MRLCMVTWRIQELHYARDQALLGGKCGTFKAAHGSVCKGRPVEYLNGSISVWSAWILILSSRGVMEQHVFPLTRSGACYLPNKSHMMSRDHLTDFYPVTAIIENWEMICLLAISMGTPNGEQIVSFLVNTGWVINIIPRYLRHSNPLATIDSNLYYWSLPVTSLEPFKMSANEGKGYRN